MVLKVNSRNSKKIPTSEYNGDGQDASAVSSLLMVKAANSKEFRVPSSKLRVLLSPSEGNAKATIVRHD